MSFQPPLWFWHVFSFASAFAVTYLLYGAPRSFLFAAAIAVILFVLFGPLALPGFFLAIGVRALTRKVEEKKTGKAKKKRS